MGTDGGYRLKNFYRISRAGFTAVPLLGRMQRVKQSGAAEAQHHAQDAIDAEPGVPEAGSSPFLTARIGGVAVGVTRIGPSGILGPWPAAGTCWRSM